MANISDAFGDFKITKVGNEFIDFIKAVQGINSDAYYRLIEVDSILEDYKTEKYIEPDENGDLEFSFSTGGRWGYTSNIEGYLMGQWMENDKNSKKAYDKFIKALIDKNGTLTITYNDSDTAMDWMGEGIFEMFVDEGELQFADNFIEQDFTLENFANQQGESEKWALEYVYGDEVASAYEDYLDEWEKDHSAPEFEGMQPAGPEEWYNNEYQEV